jgi:hypothetical protein
MNGTSKRPLDSQTASLAGALIPKIIKFRNEFHDATKSCINTCIFTIRATSIELACVNL